MKKSLVPPVTTTTVGGYRARIFEIDPNDIGDGLGGMIATPGMGDIAKTWNDCGICRDADDSCNLDPKKPEVADVIRQLNEARGR